MVQRYKTMQRAGMFRGHIMPGTAFVVFPLMVLCLSWIRARKLYNNDIHSKHAVSFAQAHIPERSHSLLWRTGWVVTVVSGIGAMAEMSIMIFVNPYYKGVPHVALYSCFFLAGMACVLEGCRRLPRDSHRQVLAAVLSVEFALLYHHALMKDEPSDMVQHMLLACLAGVNVLALMYSIHNPSSVVAFIAGWALIMMQGFWWITLAFFISFTYIEAHHVTVVFAAECLVIILIIMCAIAFGINLNNNNYPDNDEDEEKVNAYHSPKSNMRDGGFLPLNTSDDNNKSNNLTASNGYHHASSRGLDLTLL